MTIRFAFAAILLLFGAHPAMGACLDGTVRPIDFFAPTPGQIVFVAAPSLQDPVRGYVVRVSSAGPQEPQPKIEVIQLLRDDGCPYWSMEKQWKASLTAGEHAEVVRAAMAWMTPRNPASSFRSAWPDDRASREGVDGALRLPPPPPATDGTQVVLRLRGSGWEILRYENHSTKDGAALSAIFYPLVAKYVPAPDIPTSDWRTRTNE